MRTTTEPDRITPLPPPPAPTARDANPWPISARQPTARRAALPGVTRGHGREPRSGRSVLPSLVAVAIALMVLVSALVRAGESSRFGDLVGPGIALFFVLIFAVSRLRRARRRAGSQSPPADVG
jgi:hypothetical protein